MMIGQSVGVLDKFMKIYMFRSENEEGVAADFEKAEKEFKEVSAKDKDIQHAMVVEGDTLTLICSTEAMKLRF